MESLEPAPTRQLHFKNIIHIKIQVCTNEGRGPCGLTIGVPSLTTYSMLNFEINLV